MTTFRILIEMVTQLGQSQIHEIGGRLVEGDLANDSVGYVKIDDQKIEMIVKNVAFMRPNTEEKIAFSVEKLPCPASSLIGKEFVSKTNS